jgi:3D (Asp-Asp-Asp) domain-containing protein
MKILCRISVLLLASWILFKNEITSPSNKTIIPNKTKNQMVDSFIKDAFPKKEIKVRLTAYWAKGSDTDSDTAKRRSSTGATLKPNKSVAVDPRIIPYFSRLYIPNLGFRVAHDTGTDVIRKKASHGKYPIVDIFFMTEKEAMRFVNNNPKIVKIAVY